MAVSVAVSVPVPLPRLAVVVALASVVVLFLPGSSLVSVVLLDVALLAVAALDWALAASPRALPVTRSSPDVVVLGATATVAWTVSNPTRRVQRVALADDLAPSLGAATRRARLTVAPGGRAAASTTISPTRRGRFDLAGVVLRVEGPLRLAARQRTVPLPAVLRVHPPFRSRDEAELRIERARVLEVGLRSAQGRGAGTDFDQLRDYSVDDEYRRVDWAATARAGRPVVRTYRAERNQTVLLLLDTGRVMAGQVGGAPRLEHAMDAVLTVTAVAAHLGDRVGMVAFDREVRSVVPAATGRSQLNRVSEALVTLAPALVESDYRRAFAETLARWRRRALLVVLTDLNEAAASEVLVPALPLVARRHLVMVTGVRDPVVAAWARAEVPGASGAYRRAAALASMEERDRTVARLRALGATVLDAEPGELAPALADAYLRAKATARL